MEPTTTSCNLSPASNSSIYVGCFSQLTNPRWRGSPTPEVSKSSTLMVTPTSSWLWKKEQETSSSLLSSSPTSDLRKSDSKPPTRPSNFEGNRSPTGRRKALERVPGIQNRTKPATCSLHRPNRQNYSRIVSIMCCSSTPTFFCSLWCV